MAKFSLDLSEGLEQLAAELKPYETKALVLAPGDAKTLRACVDLLWQAARRLENEVSRHRWNEGARELREQSVTATVVEEAARPGSNVKMFPGRRIVASSDGATGGVA